MKKTCLFLMIAVAATAAQVPARSPEPPNAEEKREIETKMTELAGRVKALAAPW